MEFVKFIPLGGFITFILSITWRIIRLKKRGIKVTSGYSGINLHKIFLFLLFGILLMVWLTELIIFAFEIPESILPPWLNEKIISLEIFTIAGALLILGSVAFLFITLLHFKDSLRFGLDENNQGELMTRGIFSISRNPFFISINLYFTGLAIIHPTPFFIIMAVLTLISIHIFILKEERFLRTHHGDEYHKYSNRVRRYL
jgi:protein-S-isoprenylcysteine O-methyltransferase Ste14